MNHNIFKCKKCGLILIDEETSLHECKKVLDYRIEDNILWMFDGITWILRKLVSTPKNKHPFSTPDDETEPKIIFTCMLPQ